MDFEREHSQVYEPDYPSLQEHIQKEIYEDLILQLIQETALEAHN